MRNRISFVLGILATLIMAGLWSAAFGQTNENNLANVSGGGSTIRFEIVAQNAGITLTITAPDGRSFTKEYKPGASPEFTFDRQGLPDGSYGYELRLRPILTDGQKEEMKRLRGKDDDPEAERAGRKRPVLPNMVQSGAFALMNGQVIVAGLIESRSNAKTNVQPASTGSVASGNTAARLRNHRISLTPMFDIVHADDVIIQGSLCVGFDCVNGESFGFDTIRLKENNTRIKFEDTSVGSFPTNDWQITANDSASGGSSKFSIEDITGSKVPFTITAGAATNSIFVDSTGRVGFRTSTPVLDLHVKTGNTPALRLEQSNASGFTAQTWDIGANEANFFVRDVTGGSKLSLRIRPGAPTSSLDISADGDVGIGTSAPGAKLDSAGNIQVSVNSATNYVSGKPNLDLTGLFIWHDNATKNLTPTGVGVAINRTGTAAYFTNAGGSSAIFDAGTVGIGTTAPTATLSVNGTANKPGGGSWDVFSDERLKNIKGQFTPGLSAVMRLQPLRYQYKPNNSVNLGSEKEYVGFGAQALQEILPEAVTRNANGYLQVNNDPIIWTMLNAIKEQQKEIEQLRGEVRKLRTASHRRRK
ncbi:MAG: tail fiber domain-containing protein [Pyrinomonadaceae bacterium]